MTGWLWTHCRRKYVHGVVQRRSLTSSPPNERFDVLFLGRDEFSCSVLRELHAAKGMARFRCVIVESLNGFDIKTCGRASRS